MSSIGTFIRFVKPATGIFEGVTETGARTGTQFGDIFKTLPGAARGSPGGPSIIDQLFNFLRGKPEILPRTDVSGLKTGLPNPGEGALIKTQKTISISTGTKILVGGTAGGGILFGLSPQGQNLINTGGKLGDQFFGVIKPLSQTLGSSPLLLVGLIILGGVLLLKK